MATREHGPKYSISVAIGAKGILDDVPGAGWWCWEGLVLKRSEGRVDIGVKAGSERIYLS